MELPLQIIDTESKVGGSGKSYLRVNTTEGWLSCFIKTTSEAVVANKGKWVKMILGGKGQFENKNILDIKLLPIQPGPVTENVGEPIKERVAVETGFKLSRSEATMILSYTKDLVVAGKLERDDFHFFCFKMRKVLAALVGQEI